MVANNLHVIKTELDFDTLIGGSEETESVEGELELRTDSNKDASLWLYTILPAKLKPQDVFVLIWLQEKMTRQGKDKNVRKDTDTGCIV